MFYKSFNVISRHGTFCMLCFTCSVPNLKLDPLPLDVDGTDLEVYADGGDVVTIETVVCKPEQML